MVSDGNESEVPPFFKVTNYFINKNLSIDEMHHVPWKGKEKRLPTIYMGHTILRRGGEQKHVDFIIDARSIHEAVHMLPECLDAVIEDLNKPNIVIP